MAEHRFCEYRECGICIDEMVGTAKYCCPDHRYAEHNARRHDPHGTRYPVGKACRAVYRSRRRPNRDGSGTRIYVTRAELRKVHTATGDYCLVPPELGRKLLKAQKRLGAVA